MSQTKTPKRSKLSKKGQLTIPKEIRVQHGWGPGTALVIEDHGSYLVLRANDEEPVASWDDLIGCVPYDGPPLSIADMDQAITEMIRKRW